MPVPPVLAVPNENALPVDDVFTVEQVGVPLVAELKNDCEEPTIDPFEVNAMLPLPLTALMNRTFAVVVVPTVVGSSLSSHAAVKAASARQGTIILENFMVVSPPTSI